MQMNGRFKARRYRSKREQAEKRSILYSACFIVALLAGMTLTGYLNRKGGSEALAITKSDTSQVLVEGAPVKTEEPTNNDQSQNTKYQVPVDTSVAYQINEEFLGTSLNPNLWQVMERSKGYRNNEEQAYTASQVQVMNGTLVITAARNTAGEWVSGEINSKWSYTYGDFEVRAKLSHTGQGVWPAAWLFNSEGTWPNGGEIDIFENINGQSAVYGTIHAGGAAGHWQKQAAVYRFDVTEYHTYKISKHPGVISWWVDGVKRAEWQQSSFSTDAWPFENYSYIGLLNLAIGGNWPGATTPSTPSEIKYSVEYFRVSNAR